MQTEEGQKSSCEATEQVWWDLREVSSDRMHLRPRMHDMPPIGWVAMCMQYRERGASVHHELPCKLRNHSLDEEEWLIESDGSQCEKGIFEGH